MVVNLLIKEEEREEKKESARVREYIDTRCETRASKLSICGSIVQHIQQEDGAVKWNTYCLSEECRPMGRK